MTSAFETEFMKAIERPFAALLGIITDTKEKQPFQLETPRPVSMIRTRAITSHAVMAIRLAVDLNKPDQLAPILDRQIRLGADNVPLACPSTPYLRVIRTTLASFLQNAHH